MQNPCRISSLPIRIVAILWAFVFIWPWIVFAQVAESNLLDLDLENRIEGSFIVVLKDDDFQHYMMARGIFSAEAAARSRAQDYAAIFGGKIEATYGTALRGFVLSGINDATAKMIADDAGVAYVQADRLYKADATQFSPPWGLDRIDQRALPLNGQYVYQYDGTGVNVYVIDSGISAHTDFGARLHAGETFISDGNGTKDCSGHGTHVAGIIGGATYGVAKNVALYPVRVLDCGGYGQGSSVLSGVNWVASKAVVPAVVNMSLGGPGIDTALNQALSNLMTVNSVSVSIAAGNYSDDACLYSPAVIGGSTNAVTVGNTTDADVRNSGSNWGRCLTLFAPGTNIRSAAHNNPTGSVLMTGTSMAAPHVSGAMALYLQTNQTATPAGVKSAIIYASTRGKVQNNASSPNRLLYTGFGQSGGSDTPFTSVPPAPSNLDAMCVGGVRGTRWTLWWSASGDVGSFLIYRNGIYLARSSVSSIDVGVGSFSYAVKSCNGAGCSGLSPSLLLNATAVCP